MLPSVLNTGKTATAALFCLAAVIAVLSCEGTQPSALDSDKINVEAYLYAGRPVADVQLRYTAFAMKDTFVSMEMYDKETDSSYMVDTLVTLTSGRFVDNALVTISCDGAVYNLTFTDSGRYRDASGSLLIVEGQTYRFDVTTGERHVWAETTVPPKLGGIRLSRDTIYTDLSQPVDTCDKYNCPDKPEGDTALQTVVVGSRSMLTAKWNNPGGAYFYCKILLHVDHQSSTGEPDPKNKKSVAGDTVPDQPAFRQIFSHYINIDSLKIVSYNYDPSKMYWDASTRGINLLEPGRYTLLMYSTAPEFRLMLSESGYAGADTTNQDTWRKSSSNINDGLGFFSSFCIDSVQFTIVPSESGR